ncbi:hypothetical protein Ddye_016359 [Dipteronia dyeriana]|uniref:Endonuclease/exonuclease/phosphatase domain-containing protein n=1 Tax=Dipteronia dyeriana TaxID=168575 RepID=A0AAD9X0E1_9ROSI|nr:hypothetical protein Ddye_016359 [Dipteronia dyeriana]
MVIGDFNAIRVDSERIGGHPRPLISMLECNDCLDKYCLFDLHSIGCIMSWCNDYLGVNKSWEKLDRVVSNNTFSVQFASAQLVYLKRKTSNHCPMVVHLELPFSSYGLVPFRFQNMWCLHETFLDCVQDIWDRHDSSFGL